MEIRMATTADIDMLVDIRMEFVTLIRSIANKSAFQMETKRYLESHIEDDSMFFYICVDEGKIVSSCLLCIYQTIPTPSSLNGKSGLLLNVYTIKEYRRRGIARKLLSQLIDEARKQGVSKILLDYTDDGFPLYQSLGFQKLDRQMCLYL